MKYNVLYLFMYKKELFLTLSLFLQISLFAEGSIREINIGGQLGSELANNGNTYSDNLCNPFVYTSFTVRITSSNCFGNTSSSYGFNTLPYGDSRCPNQQLKTGRGKSDIEIEVKEIDAENYLIKTNAGPGNAIHLYTMDGATLLESKNKEVLVKKTLVKDKIILIQASDNQASSSKKYFFGN